MECKIYCLIDPRDGQVKYIGKAKYSLEKRLLGHLGEELKRNHKRSSWLKSLLSKGLRPSIELLDVVQEIQVNFWEKHYISLYKSWGFDLKNGTIGGDGGATRSGCKQSKEEVEKRIRTRRNNGRPWVSQEQRELSRSRMKGNIIHKGHIHSIESKEKIRNEKLKQVTPEFRNKMRLINIGNQNRKGKTMSVESKAKLQRGVVQKDLHMNIIAKFISITEAIQTTGIKGIANVLTGRANTAGGYKWEYSL